ncbi:hypothetical protein WN944_016735 [Citrus x changshan-huyou]|uniref:Uncharacterized protein n=1 Tax=Citrus x changshan-huyou TaxID=2935761 RepID=A0AAP0QN39_9ROSI
MRRLRQDYTGPSHSSKNGQRTELVFIDKNRQRRCRITVRQAELDLHLFDCGLGPITKMKRVAHTRASNTASKLLIIFMELVAL